MGFCNFVFAVLSTQLVKVVGRRPLLLYGQIFMSFFMMMIGFFKVTKSYTEMFITMNLFIGAFQLSIGSVAWLYVAETTVDQASGFCMTGNFITCILISFSMEYLMASALQVQGTFWLFGVLTAIGAIFVFFFVKETRGLSDKEKKSLYS